ncbi:MAG: AraC family transcriptional regulator [Rhodococcus sp. (in: high G+C Gram-positive bacteria)]
MSKTRHPDEPAVRGYAVTHPAGDATLLASSGWDRLVYTASGALSVRTDRQAWTVPPHRALWMPDGLATVVRNRYPVAVRVLYFAADLHAAPSEPTTVVVSGFPRHLLSHVVRVCPLDVTDPGRQALLTVLLEQLRGLPNLPLALPLPRGLESRRAGELILAGADPPTAARGVGVGLRTLERRFVTETGLSLGAWRRRARILGSVESLAAGASVTDAGARAG